ncbi:MAG: hypothetical protein E7673_01000 [Ruminococcaceae bacterium]|nr:hypothetical protein [Oscillospiraceae bacterium]
MENKYEKITPVLLGGDLNAYSMAMSFAEAFGVVSEVFSRERLAITDFSSYINNHTVRGLAEIEVAVPELISFAKSRAGEKLLLIPCADWYVEMLEYARDALTGHFYFHIPDFEVWRAVSDKASFTRLMDKYGVPHPKTEIFDEKFQDFQKKGAKMRPPFVLKPSDSSEYWRNPFPDMKKVYFVNSLGEAKKIGERIYSSGYGGKIILQEYIGDFSEKATASTLTVYMDRYGRAVRAVLGDILLEELGPTARGNYSAIVTRPLDSLSRALILMLEGIKYTGIANFDILSSGGKSFCLELNPRQGRSFDYLRCAGVNIARLLLSDMNGEKIAPEFEYPNGIWRAVRRKTVQRHSTERALLKKATELEKNGSGVYAYDLRGDKNLRRMLYVFLHMRREEKRYRKYTSDDSARV